MLEDQCLSAVSWNVAAVNNNPFEYWIQYFDDSYDCFMRLVEEFMQDDSKDFPVFQIFTDAMFDELLHELSVINADNVGNLEYFWRHEYRNRMAIREFLKDKTLGSKRLISMPDRITNTIFLEGGGLRMRPTVINAYGEGGLESIQAWWPKWKAFIFETRVDIADGGPRSDQHLLVSELISPLSRAKYPAISVEEQAVSVALQHLCLAIMDAILIHIVNTVAGGCWEEIRRALCEVLITEKNSRICSILASACPDANVIFLQEAAASFAQNVRQHEFLNERFVLVQPDDMDGKRNQNSLILVDRARFDMRTSVDVTAHVLGLSDGRWAAAGDLFVVSITDFDQRRWLLASFHGDSNGLMTQPLLCAIDTAARSLFNGHTLLVGLDANTHSHATAFHQSLQSFVDFLADKRMTSIWGPSPSPELATTCSSRTYLQTQLNKATPYTNRAAAANRGLKDWILAYEGQVLGVMDAARDNTGRRIFLEGVVFPSTDFPSDHAIVSAVFSFKPAVACPPIDQSSVLQRPRSISITREDVVGELTLYDYWGIRKRPLAHDQMGSAGSFFEPLEEEHRKSIDAANRSELFAAERAVERVLELSFANRARKAREEGLDAKNTILARSEDRSVWLLFSPRGMSLGLDKRWVLPILMLLAVAHVVGAWLQLGMVYRMSAIRGLAFRFTPLEARGAHAERRFDAASCLFGGQGCFLRCLLPGAMSCADRKGCFYLGLKGLDTECGSENMTRPGIHSWGLLRNGRMVGALHNASVSGPSFTITFADEQIMNGWWFRTATAQPVENDPVRFYVERWSDEGWTDVGYPPWMLKRSIRRVPLARGALKMVDLRPDLRYMVSLGAGIHLVPAIGLLVMAAFNVAKQGRLSVISGSLMCGVQLVISLTCAIYDSFVLEEHEESSSEFYWALCMIWAAFSTFVYTECYVLEGFLIHSIFYGAVLLYHRIALRSPFPLELPAGEHDDGISFCWTKPLTMHCLAMIIYFIYSVSALVARHFVRRWVFYESVKLDKAGYDSVWSKILRDNSSELALLKRICSNVKSSHSSLRQEYSKSCTMKKDGTRSIEFLWPYSRNNITTNLDQIFSMAACLDIFYIQKVSHLAKAHGGLLPCILPSSNQVVYCSTESLTTESAWQSVQWVRLKTPDRALEKLVRCYCNDASRLVDCTRQALVFEKLGNLVDCLSSLLVDAEIEVVRIKNRLDGTINSILWAGYR